MIVPTSKKDVAFATGNYRGVHLTPILSKIAEKVIGKSLGEFLQRYSFRKRKWAFTPGLGPSDLVTKLVMEWVLVVCIGKKVRGYLSVISEASDRVCKEYLMSKLNAAGVGQLYLNWLDSYLFPRQGQVVVEGEFSELFEIADSVFQGTVLGPCLWNTFFADISGPATSTGGSEAMFADDLNVFQKFDRFTSTDEVTEKLGRCREKVHAWGKANRVSFDASKEFIVIIHPRLSFGDPFKLLGCLLDTKLTMRHAVDAILSKVRPRIKALLRTRSHYSVPSLIEQFKTHVWGLMETHSGGIFHAATSILDQLDRVQNHFLKELGMPLEEAFLEFHFAPPTLRRNIAILGMIHKRVIGQAHPSFDALLPFFPGRAALRGNHSKQMYNHCNEVNAQWDLYRRSIFAMVDIYNNLSQEAVDSASVETFQSYLTRLARVRCQQGNAKWMYTHDFRSR